MADWQDKAACRGLDPNLFFPPPGGDLAGGALAVCARCPVAEACLRAALLAGPAYEVYGIWGGTNQQQRRGLKVAADGQIVPVGGGRTCKRCGGSVLPGAAKAQKLCDACRGPRACEECGREFQPGNPEQATCSHRCAGRRMRRQTQERKRPSIPVHGQDEGIKHGSPAGYRQHRYRGIDPCAECREANARRDRDRRAETRQELEKVRAERPTPAWPPPAETPRADLARELATPAERSA